MASSSGFYSENWVWDLVMQEKAITMIETYYSDVLRLLREDLCLLRHTGKDSHSEGSKKLWHFMKNGLDQITDIYSKQERIFGEHFWEIS